MRKAETSIKLDELDPNIYGEGGDTEKIKMSADEEINYVEARMLRNIIEFEGVVQPRRHTFPYESYKDDEDDDDIQLGFDDEEDLDFGEEAESNFNVLSS